MAHMQKGYKNNSYMNFIIFYNSSFFSQLISAPLHIWRRPLTTVEIFRQFSWLLNLQDQSLCPEEKQKKK